MGLPRETPSDVRHRGDRPARARQRGRRAGTRGRRHGGDVAAPWSRRRRRPGVDPLVRGRPGTPPARGRRPRAPGAAAHASPSGRWVSPTTASSTTPRLSGPAWRRRARSSVAPPTPRCWSVGLDRWGLDETLDAHGRHVRLRAWDRRSRTLHLARDRFGEKPLFYGWAGGRFAFASELKAFHALPRFEPVVDRDAVAQFLRLSCVPAPHLHLPGSGQAPPRYQVSRRPRGPPGPSCPSPCRTGRPTTPSTRRWRSRRSVDDREAMRPGRGGALGLGGGPHGGRRARRRPPFGRHRLEHVVALMQRHSPRPVRTFTVSLRRCSPSTSRPRPRPWPRTSARTTRRSRCRPRRSSTSSPVWPTSGTSRSRTARSSPPTWCRRWPGGRSPSPCPATGATSSSPATTATPGSTGSGAWRARCRVPSGEPWAARSVRVPPGAIDSAAAMSAVALAGPPALDQGGQGGSRARGVERRAMPTGRWSPTGRTRPRWCSVSRPTSTGGCPDIGGADVMSQLLRADLTTYLPDDILTKVDRASMAVSLETRAPFLDRAVLDARVAASARPRSCATGVPKWLLRQVLVPARARARWSTGPRWASACPSASGCAGRSDPGPRTSSPRPRWRAMASSTRYRYAEPGVSTWLEASRPRLRAVGRAHARGVAESLARTFCSLRPEAPGHRAPRTSCGQ